MNPYELMIVFDPNLGEEKIDAILGKIENKIKAGGGELTKTDKWGTRRLASMMKKAKKLQQGYYAIIYFKAETSVPAQLQQLLKVTENVIRYSVYRGSEKPLAEIEGTPVEAGAVEAVNVGEIKEVAPAPEGEVSGQS